MANKPLDTTLLDRAIVFAVRAHAGTERRGKGFPYIVHPMEAVEIVATMTPDQEMLAAAALHATRGDNIGAMTWYKALTAAAQTHDVLVLWGHNHTLEEFGDSLDQYSYLLTAGDSIDIQGDSITGVLRCPLNFTYANAGYLKLGRASVITFTDTDRNGHYDMMELRRYSLEADEPDRQFGLTGKPNPYVITFSSPTHYKQQ